MKVFLHIVGWTTATVLLLQLIPIEDPSVSEATPEDEINAPVQIESLLKRSCYDCHSNTTDWPWYAHIAPISLEVKGHVRDGRRWLNFHIWNRYDDKKKKELLEGIIKTIDIKMPPPSYLMMHDDAKLTSGERDSIKKWAKSQLND